MTSQELYEIVRKEIDVRASLDPAFRYSQQQLDRGNGDFTNSDECSKVLATILGEELAKHILELGVGEGRSEVCQQLLKDHFDKVSRNFERAQSTVDRGKGIDLGTVTPEFPAERAKEVGHSLDDPTVSDEKIQRRCQGAVTNVAKSMHDSFVKENARVRDDLGLKPIIERFGSMPCKWCADVAGKYRFGEQPDDIFRRHDNCNCTIIYDTQVLRGKKDENGKRTRTWEEINPKEIEENAFNPTIFTQEQARQMEQSQLNQITRFTPEQVRNLSLTTGGNSGIIEIRTTLENGEGIRSGREVELPEKVQQYLQDLQKYGDYIVGDINSFTESEASAMSRETGVEFSRLTIGDKTVLIRGDSAKTPISQAIVDKIAETQGTWDFHTHPFDGDLIPSPADRDAMALFESLTGQETSKIVTPDNQYCIFSKNGIIEKGIVSNTIDADYAAFLESLFGGE